MWCEGLDFEDWEEKYDRDEQIMLYLHGQCDDWVNENYQDGDQCVAIIEFSEEIKKWCLMHSCLFRNGKYVDVRGDTESFDDVIDGFDYGYFEVEKYDTLKAFNKRMKKLGVR